MRKKKEREPAKSARKEEGKIQVRGNID